MTPGDGFDFPEYARKPSTQRLAVHAFVDASWREVGDDGTDVTALSLSCVTYNTWFQGPDKDTRYAGLLHVLQQEAADVILLQEVTMQLLGALMEAAWVRERYRYARAPFRADAIPSHGTMVLSKLPVANATLHPIPTNMGRALLTAEVRVGGSPLVLATVHLESMKGHADTRGEQLQTVFGLLEAAPDVILAGDFNFCSSVPEENNRIDPRYADVWPLLRPGEAGYTQDTDANAMLAKAKGEAKRVRIDRMLLRSDGGRWRAQAIEMLGTRPVSESRPKIFPSDHFGLRAAFLRAQEGQAG
ncbi:MAG: endonuclease/exonuclease/phosphatase family protein [Burkholderiales bacterium]|nr:endonuclease/exonuclease/phosphatase family protein [Burkholderiales bacterium]